MTTPTRRAGRGPRGRLALAALALAALAAAASAARMSQQPASASGLSGDSGDWRPPAFCRKKDCPRFDVVQTRDDVELRRYAPAHWITTNVSSSKWDDAYSEGYKRLERYAQGDNVNGTKLDATNPSFTLFYVADAKAHTLQATYTIEYFVPFELQDAPPRPNSTDLGVTRVEAQDVWVLSFGGFATEETVVTRGFEFMANLTGDGQEIEEAFIGLALYDQPARLVKRHNELWLWAKNAPSAAAAAQAPGPQRSAAQRWRQLFSAAWVAATGGERRN